MSLNTPNNLRPTSRNPLRPGSPNSNYESAALEIQQEKKMVAALKRLSIGHMMNYDPDLPPTDELLDFQFDLYPERNRSRSSSSSLSRSPLPISPSRNALSRSNSLHKALSNHSVDSEDSEEEVDTESLLWVPANLHPEVAPDDYKNHVKTTVEDIMERQILRKNLLKRKSSLSTSISRHDSLQKSPSSSKESSPTKSKSPSPVKTPPSSTPLGSNEVSPSHRFSNPSLRDLSNELERLSKLAGRNSTDAVTVARTLSASSLGYTDVEKQAIDELNLNQSPTAIDDVYEPLSPSSQRTYEESLFPYDTVNEDMDFPVQSQFSLKRSRRVDYRKSLEPQSAGSKLQNTKANRISSLRNNLSSEVIPQVNQSSSQLISDPSVVPLKHDHKLRHNVNLLNYSNQRSSQQLFNYRAANLDPTGGLTRDSPYGQAVPTSPLEEKLPTTKYSQRNLTAKRLSHIKAVPQLQPQNKPLHHGHGIGSQGQSRPRVGPAGTSRSSSGGSVLSGQMFSGYPVDRANVGYYGYQKNPQHQPSIAEPAGSSPLHSHHPLHYHPQQKHHQHSKQYPQQLPQQYPQQHPHTRPQQQQPQHHHRHQRNHKQGHQKPLTTDQQYPTHSRQQYRKNPVSSVNATVPGLGYNSPAVKPMNMPVHQLDANKAKKMPGYLPSTERSSRHKDAARPLPPNQGPQRPTTMKYRSSSTGQVSRQPGPVTGKVLVTSMKSNRRPEFDTEVIDSSKNMTENVQTSKASHVSPSKTDSRSKAKLAVSGEVYKSSTPELVTTPETQLPYLVPQRLVKSTESVVSKSKNEEAISKSAKLNENLNLLRSEINEFKESLSKTEPAIVTEKPVIINDSPDLAANPDVDFSFEQSYQDLSFEDKLDMGLIEENQFENEIFGRESENLLDNLDEDQHDDLDHMERENITDTTTSSEMETLKEIDNDKIEIANKVATIDDIDAQEISDQSSADIPVTDDHYSLPLANKSSHSLVSNESIQSSGSNNIKTSPTKPLKKKKSWPWMKNKDHERDRSVSSSTIELSSVPESDTTSKATTARSVSSPELFHITRDKRPSEENKNNEIDHVPVVMEESSRPNSKRELVKEPSGGKENVISKLFKRKRSNSVTANKGKQKEKAPENSSNSKDVTVNYESDSEIKKSTIIKGSNIFKKKTPKKEESRNKLGLKLLRSASNNSLNEHISSAEPSPKDNEMQQVEVAEPEKVAPTSPVEAKMKASKPTEKQRSKKEKDNAKEKVEDNTEEKPGETVGSEDKLTQTTLEVQEKIKKSIKRTSKANQPIEFTDSAFGFPLPPPSQSTLIMLDYRFPVHVERAIYRLSHLKLANPKRLLREQVLLSNFMYAYLNLVDHTLHLEQQMNDDSMTEQDEEHENQEAAKKSEEKEKTSGNATDEFMNLDHELEYQESMQVELNA